MFKIFLCCFAAMSFLQTQAQDTLLFRLSNPWNTVKDPNGKYLRKAVNTDSGWLTLDYNASNILVARSYYTDTNFNRKLHCHYYYNEKEGYFEQIRCYENGRLNGVMASFDKNGDTISRSTMVDNTVIASKNFNDEDWDKGFIKVEELDGEFPGGEKAWYNYLSRNLVYPAEARKKKIEGEVIVGFIVSKDGKVTEVTVIKSVHPLLDAAAVRLIKKSPDWKPAIQGGRKVKAFKKQPIVFKL